ncbi:MAG: hypothetical protein AAF653_14720 [Chloroflexota bacterium]
MPIRFYIDTEQTDIFRWEFTSTWTADEVMQLHDHSNDLAAQRAPLPVYSIVDLRESAPPTVSVFSGLAMIDRNGADNWLLCVVVVERGIWLRLFKLALQTNRELRDRYRIAGSIREAYDIIRLARSQTV